MFKKTYTAYIVLLLFLVGLIIPVGNVGAATLVSNLSESDWGEASVDYDLWWAVSLTTGPNGPYTLNSATVRNNTGSSANYRVTVYTDGGGVPGNLLETLTGPAVFSGIDDRTYTSIGTLLTSNTTYWLVSLENPTATGSATWRWTNSLNQTSFDGWTIGDSTYMSNNQGAGWGFINAFPFYLSIDADPLDETAVPTMNEWGMIVFMVVAGFGAVYYLRRRRIEDRI